MTVLFKLLPYVDVSAKLTQKQKKEIFGKLPHGGLTANHYLAMAPRKDQVAAAQSLVNSS